MNPSTLLEHVRTTLFPLISTIPQPGTPLGRLLAFDDVMDIVDRAMADTSAPSFYDAALGLLNMSWEAPAEEMARIPKSGPLLVVSNHPHGLADGLLLGSLLSQVRSDVKFVANSMLIGVAPRDAIISVNPFEEECQVGVNAAALRQSLRWLYSGGALVVFPSGEVASLNLAARAIREPDWKDTAARLALAADAAVVPLRIEGSNSTTFHLAGLVHSRTRTALLPRELMNKRGCRIRIRVGVPASPARMKEVAQSLRPIQYLHWRVQALKLDRADRGPRPLLLKAPVAGSVDQKLLAREVNSLPETSCLIQQGDWQVLCTNAASAPRSLKEIGRLREIAFRAVGEGTGKSRDLDRYDRHYQHLFLWHRERQVIAGAYRLAFTSDVVSGQGPSGMYTNSLFRLEEDFFESIGPAMELGRSFIRPEFQKEFAPLLLLWKGIGRVLKRRQDVGTLFGAVSISASYRTESRSLIAGYLKRHHWSAALAAKVRPRCPWSDEPSGAAPAASERNVNDALRELESDQKGIPILLRQYLNLGGKAIALSRDRRFSDVLDVLVAVDTQRIPARSAARYLGV